MKKMFLTGILLILAVSQVVARKTFKLHFAKSSLTVFLAADGPSRQKGLMYRKYLAPGMGMLFVFDYPARYGFWMKNTYIPLSIAFLDKNKYIISISSMKPLDKTTVYSKGKALYAVEVNKGWFHKRGIKPGMAVKFGNKLLKKLASKN